MRREGMEGGYLKTRWKCALYCGAVFAAFHFYFVFLMPGGNREYLYYLDFLLLTLAGALGALDYRAFWQWQRESRRLLEQEELICRVYPGFVNQELAEHDVRILEEQLRERFQESCDLQDYVAKWCHELKLPLAAGLLIQGKIPDGELRKDMREQLERMNRQISSMLLGCRLQGELFDLQVRQVRLRECVKTAIQNNQFFLIQKGFVIKTLVGEETVRTDPAWLVYVLDQLIANAIKYLKEEEKTDDKEDKPWEEPQADMPKLRFQAVREPGAVRLFVEDYGVGIRDCDLPRIFEKGFTGQNTHNGKYKSTGMGLYLAAKVVNRMGHELKVESEYGNYTRFCIVFRENSYYEVEDAAGGKAARGIL